MINWYKNNSAVGNNFKSIAFNNGKFVIGGAQNTILASRNLTSLSNLVKSKVLSYDANRIYVYVENKEVVFDQQ